MKKMEKEKEEEGTEKEELKEKLEEEEGSEEEETVIEKDSEVIICRHCHKRVESPRLTGITLVCPYCQKPVNGQYHHRDETTIADQGI